VKANNNWENILMNDSNHPLCSVFQIQIFLESIQIQLRFNAFELLRFSSSIEIHSFIESESIELIQKM